MRKQRVTNVWGLSAIPVTPVKYADDEKPTGSLAEFRVQEAAREVENQTAREAADKKKIYDQTRPLREAVRESARRLSLYWRLPLAEISQNGPDMAPYDAVAEYETGPRSTKAAEVAAFKTFKDNLSSHGCTLSNEGAERLGAFMISLAYHRGVSLTSTDNWAAALARCVELNIFADGAIAGYQQPTSIEHPQQRPIHREPSLDDFERFDTFSRTGNAKAKSLAEHLGTVEMQPILGTWLDYLKKTFDFTVPMSDFNDAIDPWFQRNNKNYLAWKSWEECRRYMVASGRWPKTLLLPDEKVAQAIEAADTASMTNYERNRFLARL